MLRFLLTLSLAFLPFALPISARAAAACPAEAPVVDRLEWWDFSRVTRSDFFLLSRGPKGIFETPAAAHLEWDQQLTIRFDHKLPPDSAGLEYTIDRFEIAVGRGYGAFRFSADFTDDCNAPGRSMFPGQAIKLKPVKVPPGYFGFPRGLEMVHVRIWGHL